MLHVVYFIYSRAKDVWSWMMRHPQPVFLKIRVKRPWGWSVSRVSSHEPNAIAVLSDNILMSMLENSSLPMVFLSG